MLIEYEKHNLQNDNKYIYKKIQKKIDLQVSEFHVNTLSSVFR